MPDTARVSYAALTFTWCRSNMSMTEHMWRTACAANSESVAGIAFAAEFMFTCSRFFLRRVSRTSLAPTPIPGPSQRNEHRWGQVIVISGFSYLLQWLKCEVHLIQDFPHFGCSRPIHGRRTYVPSFLNDTHCPVLCVPRSSAKVCLRGPLRTLRSSPMCSSTLSVQSRMDLIEPRSRG